MKVFEIEQEFLIGQKYAIEVTYCHTQPDNGEPFDEYETVHYEVGIPKRNPFLQDTIRYIRTVGDEIYIAVAKEV